MTPSLQQFRENAKIAIDDIRLQNALEKATRRFREERVEELAETPYADAMRDHFKQLRQNTLADLRTHLEIFERNAQQAGAVIHWAANAEEASQLVLNIAQENAVSLAAKSKSMTSEEIRLNHYLESDGIDVIETDLGEWIVQLAEETPSHIIAPAIHKTKEQVADLISGEINETAEPDIAGLTKHAREFLRQKFLEAGMGISGANLGIAETGSIVLVTNEGNGRMISTLPPIHIAIMGIEKITPTWNDAGVWLSLLSRSATGQPLSIYTNIITGPARAEDLDGPRELHIILLDNRRSEILGTQYQEILECIRCGACLNVCPVYQEAGGHSYDSPYSGPIGAVISPLLFGLEEYAGLPQASTLCGACLEVCPARIDLPRMLLALRQEQVEKGIISPTERIIERFAVKALSSQKLLEFTTKILRLFQQPFVKEGKLKPPGFGGHEVPALAEKPFREIWNEKFKKP